MALPLKDGGFKSRKWVSYVLTSALILLAGFFMDATVLVQVVMGLVSAYAIYNGANVGRDFVASRGNPTLPPPPPPPPYQPYQPYQPPCQPGQPPAQEEGS